MDGRANNGGARKGGGRKPKAVEEQANTIIVKAIRDLYKTDTDEGAKIKFLKKFAETSRGQQFIAEHLFGKAPQVVQNFIEDNSNKIDLEKLSTETLLKLEQELNAAD